MILDPDQFNDYYKEWQSGSLEALEDIAEILTPLAEVIASGYSNDSEYRFDLIQECLTRALSALRTYNPDVASPHKYFTSVFHNRCRTCMKVWHKVPVAPEFDNVYVARYILNGDNANISCDYLVNLITRNRTRFPSIEANILDEITRYVYSYIVTGMLPGTGRGVIKTATELFDISRREAAAVYHSSLVWLRLNNLEDALYSFDEPDELSVNYDLREIIGDDAYEVLSTLFAGISIKLPNTK